MLVRLRLRVFYSQDDLRKEYSCFKVFGLSIYSKYLTLFDVLGFDYEHGIDSVLGHKLDHLSLN